MTSQSAIGGNELSQSTDAGHLAAQLAHFDAPGWVPAFVGRWARVLRATAQEDFEDPEDIVATIERLASDMRMKSVWDELMRRRRDESAFVAQAVGHTAGYHPGAFSGFNIGVAVTDDHCAARGQLETLQDDI